MISAGKYTYDLKNIKLKQWNEGLKVTIGAFCSIAENLTIILGGNHNSDWATTYPFGHINQNIFNKFNGAGHPKPSKDIIIGNDVWIGMNSFITNGVTIGDGAIIASNSHIVKDVDPYTVVGGNPAKFIKLRFSPEIIGKLLELKWWDFSDDVINHLSPFLCSNDFEKLFKEIKYFGF